MKHLYTLILLGFVLLLPCAHAQVTITAGNATGTTQAVPYGSTCFGTGTAVASTCGFNVTFQFTDPQCCPCPTSGMVCLPGSVAYGGTGSSASFLNYHTLSYSPSNENQRITFAQKITRFQWSASGPAGPFPEPFQVQVYNGAALIGTFSFTVPGEGLRNTYYISAPQFDRVDFIETTAISADDELLGDFRIATAGCPLALSSLDCAIQVLGPQKAKVYWTTENEMDLVQHKVIRSTDSQNWETIAVEAARNVAGPNHYSYTDANAHLGINYYRVVSLGVDGSENYSNIVEAQFADEGKISVVIYPNPASDRLGVNFAGLEGKKDLSVVNQLGQTVATYTTESMTMDLPVDQLANAMYFLVVSAADGVTTQKFEVKR
jgi:Secretion system C-terminal sorting domain